MKQSTPPKKNITRQPAGAPASTKASTGTSSRASKRTEARQKFFDEKDMAFSRRNYMMMLIGVGIIILGFILMSGEEDKYGFVKTKLAVAIAVLGFLFEIYAIMWRPKEEEETQHQEQA